MSTIYVYFVISSIFFAVIFAAVSFVFVRRRNSYKKLIEKELGDQKVPPSNVVPIIRIEKVSISSACTIHPSDEDVSPADTTSTLKVHLLEAVDLPFKDPATKSCDPYVTAMLLPSNTEVVHSKYRNNTLNPTFNETLRFQNIDATKLNFMTLCVHVNDHDFFRHDETIGEILLPLRNVNLDRKPVYWKDLKPATIFEV
uniref:C2 domain-containing protein n=1 Tax=Romanomermis culicivorax TaxID=13658 RepID=A0A915KA26_ROMCU